MKVFKRYILVQSALVVFLMMVGTQVEADLILKASDADFSGSSPTNPNANDVETIVGSLLELTEDYKNDNPNETGGFAGNYSTTFSNSESDPEDALIQHTGGSSITGDEIYALAKDGDQDPRWYIWDISDWNGTMSLDFQDLWLQQGAISHVSIFSGREGGGGSSQVVPEPGSLFLLGSGMVGLGVWRWRKRKNS